MNATVSPHTGELLPLNRRVQARLVVLPRMIVAFAPDCPDMSNYSIYTLAESLITISGGAQLSGITQGDGSHLMGQTITLNSNAWTVVNIADGGTDTNFSDTDGDQLLNGAQTIYGVSYANGTRTEAEYTLTVQDPGGTTYTIVGVNMNEPGGGPAYGTVEGISFIGTFPPQGTPLTVIGTAEGPPNTGGGSTPSGTYAVPPCFTRGTLIDTEHGPRPIETLVAGDRVWTMDDGLQPLRINLSTAFAAQDQSHDPALRPILICKNALGPGRPSHDIKVSQQHRILLEDWRAQLFYGEDQVLVAAKHLVNGTSIRLAPVAGQVTYFHLIFDRHQIVSTAGLHSESFYPGPGAMLSISRAARREFYAMFPQTRARPAVYGQSARPEINASEALLLAA